MTVGFHIGETTRSSESTSFVGLASATVPFDENRNLEQQLTERVSVARDGSGRDGLCRFVLGTKLVTEVRLVVAQVRQGMLGMLAQLLVLAEQGPEVASSRIVGVRTVERHHVIDELGVPLHPDAVNSRFDARLRFILGATPLDELVMAPDRKVLFACSALMERDHHCVFVVRSARNRRATEDVRTRKRHAFGGDVVERVVGQPFVLEDVVRRRNRVLHIIVECVNFHWRSLGLMKCPTPV